MLSTRFTEKYQLTLVVSILAATLLLFFAYGQLFIEIFHHGVAGISWEWFTQNPANAGRDGGIASILASTLLVVFICVISAVPIALAIAIYLIESGHQHKLVSSAMDVLASVPSIVFGLFGYAFFVIQLDMGFSLLAGGLTLACMILPLMARLFEQSIRHQSDAFRFGAISTGMTRFHIYLFVLIPAAIKGIIAAVILSVGRALSETAALIYTAGYVDRMPDSVFDSGRTLSVHILDLAMNVPGGNSNAFTAALSLLMILLVINLLIFSFFRQTHRPLEVKL